MIADPGNASRAEPGAREARLGPLVSWRSQTEESRAWSWSRESFLVFMSSGRKQTITCISVSPLGWYHALISLKRTQDNSQPGHRETRDRGFLQTLWIRGDVMPVRLSVSVNFIWTGLFTLCSCPCHSLRALLEFAYSCCEITCKTCAKMCADYIKQSVIIHSPHTSIQACLSDAISSKNKF